MKRVCIALLLTACPADDGGGGDTRADSGAAETGGVSEVSYAKCDDPELGCEAADCRERTVDGAEWLVCIPPCGEGADCPLAPGTNTPPDCVDDRCVLQCIPGVAVCPSGSTCVDGEPAQCMWPVDPGVGSLDELCTAACDECMAGMLLGWTVDCPTDCAADLADCSAEELDAALVCPGDAACSVGGLALESCLGELSCKD
ncbi:MAG: hypothetical protein AAF721_06135 [Myxococcota bacterium]